MNTASQSEVRSKSTTSNKKTSLTATKAIDEPEPVKFTLSFRNRRSLRKKHILVEPGQLINNNKVEGLDNHRRENVDTGTSMSESSGYIGSSEEVDSKDNNESIFAFSDTTDESDVQKHDDMETYVSGQLRKNGESLQWKDENLKENISSNFKIWQTRDEANVNKSLFKNKDGKGTKDSNVVQPKGIEDLGNSGNKIGSIIDGLYRFQPECKDSNETAREPLEKISGRYEWKSPSIQEKINTTLEMMKLHFASGKVENPGELVEVLKSCDVEQLRIINKEIETFEYIEAEKDLGCVNNNIGPMLDTLYKCDGRSNDNSDLNKEPLAKVDDHYECKSSTVRENVNNTLEMMKLQSDIDKVEDNEQLEHILKSCNTEELENITKVMEKYDQESSGSNESQAGSSDNGLLKENSESLEAKNKNKQEQTTAAKSWWNTLFFKIFSYSAFSSWKEKEIDISVIEIDEDHDKECHDVVNNDNDMKKNGSSNESGSCSCDTGESSADTNACYQDDSSSQLDNNNVNSEDSTTISTICLDKVPDDDFKSNWLSNDIRAKIYHVFTFWRNINSKTESKETKDETQFDAKTENINDLLMMKDGKNTWRTVNIKTAIINAFTLWKTAEEKSSTTEERPMLKHIKGELYGVQLNRSQRHKYLKYQLASRITKLRLQLRNVLLSTAFLVLLLTVIAIMLLKVLYCTLTTEPVVEEIPWGLDYIYIHFFCNAINSLQLW